MDEQTRQSEFMLAMTTEHFVLQTAASSTISEAAARGSLYVFSLSSSLVAIGFTAQSPDVFIPLVAAVLPAVFLLGVFSVVRLVDTTLENMEYLAGIARIRSYYRTLTPEAASYFAADKGRWPEVKSETSVRLGPFIAFLGTTSSMIAFINNVVAGAGITLLVNALLGGDHVLIAVACGAISVVILMMAFLTYQRWRFSIFELTMQPARSAADKEA